MVNNIDLTTVLAAVLDKFPSLNWSLYGRVEDVIIAKIYVEVSDIEKDYIDVRILIQESNHIDVRVFYCSRNTAGRFHNKACLKIWKGDIKEVLDNLELWMSKVSVAFNYKLTDSTNE